MHVIFRESHGLEETDTPTDLGQTPADLVVLSLSDSDLGAFAEGWHRMKAAGDAPTVRLAGIGALKHPLSVDTYIEQTLAGAKGILIRLIGGVPYWPYGLQQIEALCREKGIALAVLPADRRPDERLDEISTLPVSTLRRLQHLCDTGGAVAAQAALAQMAMASGVYAKPVRGSKALPMVGFWHPEHGVYCPYPLADDRPIALITFYRSFLVSADLAAIKALYERLDQRGFQPICIFAPSLKNPDAAGWIARQVRAFEPSVVVNATSFSGRGKDGASPLDASDAPVFQIAHATSTREAWDGADRGLSPADLAMHVVLPEVDGRIFAGVISFKEPQELDADLQYSRYIHTSDAALVNAAVDRIVSWRGLQRGKGKQALVLSTYPGKGWNMAHAVGLDAIGSANAMLEDLGEATFTPQDLDTAAVTVSWDELDRLTARLSPEQLQDLRTAWGDPKDDLRATTKGLTLPAIYRGQTLVALQPERGTPDIRQDEYHDLSRTPRWSYVAFYLWLRENTEAVVHIGAHGTLEWLPGKSVALSDQCWPAALTRDLPVIYPFIVNDPGEAAQAKRRIGAVTLGHVPPPLTPSKTPDRLVRLEALLDEFSNADGLDPRRRDRLQEDIRSEAQALGVEDGLGLDRASCSAEAITRIDSFVCDVKESQYGDGLHIWGRAPEGVSKFDLSESIAREKLSLLSALQGYRIESGPSGSPYRGRTDVLPTGRNLYTTDPRSVPTRAAYTQGQTLADEFVRRHLQDHGDWPRALVVDLWGSATMRTAGEEFAMAMALLGVRPVWDKGSERVSGIEVLPIAELNRPRLDVTLRVSGLFRDVFPTLTALYNQAVRALSKRDEACDWNPFVGRAAPRVYGPAPGQFGVAMGQHLGNYSDEAKAAAGQAWLAASAWALDGDAATADMDGVRSVVANADAFVHLQDMPETDVLLAEDYATHEAGFAAAQAITGGSAALYHLDATNPDAPKARTLTEEIAKVVLGRATQPGWIAGMQRHGFRGAAEIAMTLENMGAFAQLAEVVPAHLFDAYYEATLGDPAVEAFMEDANPEALQAMRDRFAALHDAGLWVSRRNSILARMEAAE